MLQRIERISGSRNIRKRNSNQTRREQHIELNSKPGTKDVPHQTSARRSLFNDPPSVA
jgi:hypothetical protein